MTDLERERGEGAGEWRVHPYVSGWLVGKEQPIRGPGDGWYFTTETDAQRLCDYLTALEQRLDAGLDDAMLRRSYRWAMTVLNCRCMWDDKDERINADGHCPVHGTYGDVGAWFPVTYADLQEQGRTKDAEIGRMKVAFVEATQESFR